MFIDGDQDDETVREAAEATCQLLKGQQPLNPLYTMLTASDEKHRKYGRFCVDLTVARQPPSPAGAVAPGAGDAVPCVAGGAGGSARPAYDAFEARGRCLNLSRLHDWAEVKGGVDRGEEDLLACGPELLVREIDPQFTRALGG
jgi:hypothetical protein